ncbi:unnamed protein product [Staurois parvus]|uniref:Uncharacterized protein n=1 Tax=Staurois parvus TaxID=386267 RepID=A0ABN9GB69_9NEOB|nr:unnamed protein product [Staurois parvus]
MRPLQRPRPSPPANASIQLPCSGPCERRGRTGRTGAGTCGKFKNFRNCHFLINDVSNHFTYILSLLLCPVPCLHFYCSFCLET